MQKRVNFKSLSFFLLSLLLLLNSKASSAIQTDQVDPSLTPTEIIEQANNIQNPNEVLILLSQVGELESLADTVVHKYLLSYGIAYGQLGNVDSSNFFLNKCIAKANASGDDFNLMRAYNSKGVLLRIQGDHENSLAAFQSAEKICERHSEGRFSAKKTDILGNIGGIFYQLKNYQSAREYSQRALQVALSFNDTSGLAYGYLRLAIVAQAEDSLTVSLDYNKKASQFLEVMADYNSLAYVQNNLGNINKDLGEYEQAMIHQKKANEYAVLLGDSEGQAHTTLGISECYFQLGKFEQATAYAKKGLNIAKGKNFPIHSRNAHDLLFKIAEKQGNYKIALEEKMETIIVNDSLNAAEAIERLAEVETKYETEKKEAEIQRLALENDLKDSRILAGGIGFVAIIVLLIALFAYKHYKQKAEKEAQELQIEALKKRFMELHSSPSDLAVNLDFEELNGKLNTPLTDREFETLKVSLEGKTNAEISEILFISVSTVKFHLRNTYSKMGVGNRKEAFQYMLKTS